MTYNDPNILYISLHRHDNGNFFPGTGTVSEVYNFILLQPTFRVEKYIIEDLKKEKKLLSNMSYNHKILKSIQNKENV